MDKRSFLKGLALGLAGKPLEFAPGKEPVAYLYNGVRLPKLPEWDKSKYPYAFIRNVPSGTDYNELYVFKTEPAWFKPSIIVSAYGVEDGNTHLEAVDYPYGAEADWGYVTLSEKTSNGYLASGNFEGIFWANYDILNEDGTIYLAASDPVPVYE